MCAPLCGQELIAYPLQLLSSLAIPTTLVVGHKKELILSCAQKYGSFQHVEQSELRGTGHAVLCSQNYWTSDHILVLNGDAPLLEKEDLALLIERHTQTNAAVSFIAAYNADPSITGYGRVIEHAGTVSIVEQADFKGDTSEHCRLNAGIYLFKRTFLQQTLPTCIPHPPRNEIYLTDLIKKASEQKLPVEIVDIPFDRARGVNTLRELWIAEHIKKSALITDWMSKGVRFSAPQSVHLDTSVTIGPDSTIGYGVQLRGKTLIGNNVHIDAFSIIDNSELHNDVTIQSHTVVSNSHLFAKSIVGPFAHIHKQSIINEQGVIGNFVEVSKSTLGKKSKAKHLTYLGQTEVGTEVNIGAGTIVCNYNGVTKNSTTIKDHAFIGSNSVLIAPVTIGENAMTAAGSVITHDVPDEALAIARERQINKELYVQKFKTKFKKPQHTATL